MQALQPFTFAADDGKNEPPIWSSWTEYSAVVDQNITWELGVTDPDGTVEDISYQLDKLLGWSVDIKDWYFVFMPNKGYEWQASFSFYATDGAGAQGWPYTIVLNYKQSYNEYTEDNQQPTKDANSEEYPKQEWPSQEDFVAYIVATYSIAEDVVQENMRDPQKLADLVGIKLYDMIVWVYINMVWMDPEQAHDMALTLIESEQYRGEQNPKPRKPINTNTISLVEPEYAYPDLITDGDMYIKLGDVITKSNGDKVSYGMWELPFYWHYIEVKDSVVVRIYDYTEWYDIDELDFKSAYYEYIENDQQRESNKDQKETPPSTYFVSEDGARYPVYIKEPMPIIGTLVYTDPYFKKPMPAGTYYFDDEISSGEVIIDAQSRVVDLIVKEDKGNTDGEEMDYETIKYLLTTRWADPVNKWTSINIPGFGKIGGYYAIIAGLMYAVGNEFIGSYALENLPNLYKIINENAPQSDSDDTAAYYTSFINYRGENYPAEYKTAYALYLKYYKEYTVGSINSEEVKQNAQVLWSKAESCEINQTQQEEVQLLIRDYRKYMSYLQYDMAKEMLRKIDSIVEQWCRVKENTVIFPADACYEKITGLKREVERLERIGEIQESNKLVDYIVELGNTQCNPGKVLPQTQVQKHSQEEFSEQKEKIRPEQLKQKKNSATEQKDVNYCDDRGANKLQQFAEKIKETSQERLSELETRLKTLKSQYTSSSPAYILVEKTEMMITRYKVAIAAELEATSEYICGEYESDKLGTKNNMPSVDINVMLKEFEQRISFAALGALTDLDGMFAGWTDTDMDSFVTMFLSMLDKNSESYHPESANFAALMEEQYDIDARSLASLIYEWYIWMYANQQKISLLDPYEYGIVDAEGNQVDWFKFRWLGSENMQLWTTLYADLPRNEKVVPSGTYTATQYSDINITVDEKWSITDISYTQYPKAKIERKTMGGEELLYAISEDYKSVIRTNLESKYATQEPKDDSKDTPKEGDKQQDDNVNSSNQSQYINILQDSQLYKGVSNSDDGTPGIVYHYCARTYDADKWTLSINGEAGSCEILRIYLKKPYNEVELKVMFDMEGDGYVQRKNDGDRVSLQSGEPITVKNAADSIEIVGGSSDGSVVTISEIQLTAIETAQQQEPKDNTQTPQDKQEWPIHCQIIDYLGQPYDLLADGKEYYNLFEDNMHQGMLFGALLYNYYGGDTSKMFDFVWENVPNIINYFDAEGDLTNDGSVERSKDHPEELQAFNQFYQNSIYPSCGFELPKK